MVNAGFGSRTMPLPALIQFDSLCGLVLLSTAEVWRPFAQKGRQEEWLNVDSRIIRCSHKYAGRG